MPKCTECKYRFRIEIPGYPDEFGCEDGGDMENPTEDIPCQAFERKIE